MARLVYALCALTSMIVAVLLVRGFLQSRARLLLWSALCFVLLAVNNVLLFIDFSLPMIDLPVWRAVPIVAGLALLIYGLIWEVR